MRVNVAIPEAHVSAPVLDSALEATTKLNESLIRSGELAPFDMRSPGVRWRPEPPGDEHFDHGLIVQGRGHGDCDDLAPWHAASLRVTGRDPGARAFVRPSGPQRWHALVRRSNGSVEDPSLAAGMPAPGARHGVRGGVQPMMLVVGGRSSVVGGSYIMRPQLAMRPVFDRLSREVEAWQTRTDLPWHASPGRSPADIAMASLHASPIPDQALVGSLEGMIALGSASHAPEEQLDRLRCLSDMVQGATWEECAACYGPAYADAAGAIVGSFFKKLGRKIKKGFRGLAKTALKVAPFAMSFIPGVGPIASKALQAASPVLQNLIEKRQHERPEQRMVPELPLLFPQQQQLPSEMWSLPQYAQPPYAPQYAPQYAPAPEYAMPQYSMPMQWGG